MRTDRPTPKTLALLLAFLLLLLVTACGETVHEPTDLPASRTQPQIPGADPERGRALIRDHGCGSCHTIPGIRQADGRVGPPLDHWADRQYIAGALPNTPDNLVQWIRFPQAIEPGTVMPNLDLPEEDVRDMAAYLYTLTEEREFTDLFQTPRAAVGSLLGLGGGQVPETGQQGDGEQVYNGRCAQCHGPNGEGQVGPALAGNSFVTGDAQPVIDTVLHGRGQMPPFQGQLSAEEIAAVVSFIRGAWGNNAEPVTPDQAGGAQDGQQGDQGQQATPAPTGGGQAPQRTREPDSQTGAQTGTPAPIDQPPAGQEIPAPAQETPGPQQGQAGQQATPAPGASGQAEGGGMTFPQVALVELYEWGLDLYPAELPAGRVLFHVTNVGTRPLRFTLQGQEITLEFPVDLPVGETRTLFANLQPGQYTLFSPQEDYAQRGISLEFTVSESGPALPGQAGPTPAAQGTPAEEQQTRQPGQATPAPTGQAGQQATPAPTTGGQQQGQGGQATPAPDASGQQQGDGEQLVQQGEQVYSGRCAQCHGPNGEGQVGPALAGNPFVTGDPQPVIDTVLHGRGQMPPFQGQLSPEEIAAVVSFIRGAWGNNAEPVTPDQAGGAQDGQGTPQQQVTLNLSIQNRAFDQDTLTVPAGASVALNLTNQDSDPHNFALYQDSTTAQVIFIGQVFTGQQTVTYTFTAPASPGTYFFRCDVHPFMNGTFEVDE